MTPYIDITHYCFANNTVHRPKRRRNKIVRIFSRVMSYVYVCVFATGKCRNTSHPPMQCRRWFCCECVLKLNALGVRWCAGWRRCRWCRRLAATTVRTYISVLSKCSVCGSAQNNNQNIKYNPPVWRVYAECTRRHSPAGK